MDKERESLIKCPICGFDCVHLENVRVNKGGQVVTLNHESLVVASTNPAGRGSLVGLTMWCESGHKWIEHTQFHKGSLLRWQTPIFEDSTSVQKSACDLWRD